MKHIKKISIIIFWILIIIYFYGFLKKEVNLNYFPSFIFELYIFIIANIIPLILLFYLIILGNFKKLYKILTIVFFVILSFFNILIYMSGYDGWNFVGYILIFSIPIILFYIGMIIFFIKKKNKKLFIGFLIILLITILPYLIGYYLKYKSEQESKKAEQKYLELRRKQIKENNNFYNLQRKNNNKYYEEYNKIKHNKNLTPEQKKIKIKYLKNNYKK